jgi:MFS family permease
MTKHGSLRHISLATWIICGLGALFYAYEYLLRVMPNVMIPQLMDHYNISNHKYGLLFACYYFAYVPMQLPVGLLMDEYGPRRLLSLACALCVFGTYLFVATDHLIIAYIGRFLVGFGSAFAFVGVLKLASIWLPASRFAMFAGISSALGTITVVFGENIMAVMVQEIDWTFTVTLASFIGIFITVAIWFVVRDTRSSDPEEQSLYYEIDWISAWQDLKLILLNPQIWLAGGIGCLIYLPTTAFAEAWGVRYLENAQSFTPTQAAFGNSLVFLGFTIGAPLFGWLSDKLATRRLLLLYGSVFTFILSLLIFYSPNLTFWQMNLLLLLWGFAYSVQTLVFTVSRELSPTHSAGTAIAVMNMIVMLGGMLFQPLIGVILDWVRNPDMVVHLHAYSSSDYRIAFSIIPLGILVSGFCAYSLKESYR